MTTNVNSYYKAAPSARHHTVQTGRDGGWEVRYGETREGNKFDQISLSKGIVDFKYRDSGSSTMNARKSRWEFSQGLKGYWIPKNMR